MGQQSLPYHMSHWLKPEPEIIHIKLVGYNWHARLDCTRCGTAHIRQVHQRSKPWDAVDSILRTTARTLGWKVGKTEAICGACRRQK